MKGRFFQWVVGERKGEVVVLDEIIEESGIVYLSFKDQSRINTEFVAEINTKDLSGKMMAEVESPHNVWKFEKIVENKDDGKISERDAVSGEQYEIPSADEIARADLSGSGGVTRPGKPVNKIKLIPPRPTATKFGKLATTSDLAEEYEKTMSTYEPKQNVEQAAPDKPQQDVNDPVYIMMEKSKKINTEVEMTVTISLPTKSLFDVANESFDNGGEKVIKYIIENLDLQNIKDELRDALLRAYDVFPTGDESFYKAEVNPDIKLEALLSEEEPKALEEPVIGDSIPQEKQKETEKK